MAVTRLLIQQYLLKQLLLTSKTDVYVYMNEQGFLMYGVVRKYKTCIR